MRNLVYLVQRNIELFLNNRLNILLSMASIPIIISLYVFFLRDFLIGMMGQMGLPSHFINEFTDRIMFAGLLVVMNTTTCFGMLQICVNDSAMGIKRDFLVAPIIKFVILLGYWIGAVTVSCGFTYGTILMGEIFFRRTYGSCLSVSTMIYLLGATLCASSINSGILLCFSENLKNTTTFSTFANLYGTVLGFLSGSYLPYYFYPDWLKPILFWFPPTQMTSILRREYVKDLSDRIINYQNEKAIANIFHDFGIQLEWKSKGVQLNQQWSMLVLSLAVLLLYLYIRSSKKQK